MYISTKDWLNFINKLSALNDKASDSMMKYVQKNGFENTDELVDYAYAVANTYGNASASLSAAMYDAVTELEGKFYPAAEPAEPIPYGEVARQVQGTMKNSKKAESVAAAVGRLVKLQGQDTLLNNGIRDGAEFAWIPHGDTCAFCITLASNGWRPISKKAMKNGHAEHIHANCDCSYMIRHSSDVDVEGYDPEKYYEMYSNAEGKNGKQKINALRRQFYAANKTIVGPESSKAEEFIVAIDSRFNEKGKQNLTLLNTLVSEYDSPLREVEKGGATSAGEKGFVGIGTRNKMNLSSTASDTAIHEFAHTLAMKKEDDLQLSDNKDFWNEIAKIRREYNKAVAKDPSLKISAYSKTNIDEFMAESFTLAKMVEMGLPITNQTGLNEKGLSYAQKVLEVINKYFKRK